ALRLDGQLGKAEKMARRALKLDPLDPWAMNELMIALKEQGKPYQKAMETLSHLLRGEPQAYIELALDYSNSGLYAEASQILELDSSDPGSGFALSSYYNGYFKTKLGNKEEASRWFKAAMKRPVDNVFPFRTEAIDVFKTALEYLPQDDRAHYYLGLVYAGMADVDSAISHWTKAVELDPRNPRAWRNLGLSFLRSGRDLNQAKSFYKQAFKLVPEDSRVLMELHGVMEALGEERAQRLAFLRKHEATVKKRDDLLTSMLDLMVQEGDYEEALDYYASHHFHNWEGRYVIHNAYMEANMGLAKAAKTPREALKHYLKACEYPANLKVAPREPNLRGFLYYPMAQLYEQLNNEEEALRLLKITAVESSSMPTVGSFYQALALRELGKSAEADQILSTLKSEGRQLIQGKTRSYARRSKTFRQALGYHYLSKAHEASGEAEKASQAREKAVQLVPMIEREALMFAQIVFARTHQ
ncbi:tetratricopeptide repeat protein, partial [Acidobacteria bacterium AH-259-O06]|nr:tetratricopeptide repeat protein [Acidobacteria bacterium AH-259-O06]